MSYKNVLLFEPFFLLDFVLDITKNAAFEFLLGGGNSYQQIFYS